MDKNEYINKVLAHISNKAFVSTIKAELENHIADREAYYTEIGYDTQTAEQKAMEHMGNADTVGEEMNMLQNYKKHKIISIAALVLSALILLFIKYLGGYFNWFFNMLSAPMLCTAAFLTCIIYRYAFLSRSRAVLFLLGLLNFFWSVYFTESFNFTWIENIWQEDRLYSLYSIFGTFAEILFVVHSIICLTCCGEITAIIKGRPNFNIMKRYEKYGNFLFLFTIVCIVITVGFLFIQQ